MMGSDMKLRNALLAIGLAATLALAGACGDDDEDGDADQSAIGGPTGQMNLTPGAGAHAQANSGTPVTVTVGSPGPDVIAGSPTAGPSPTPRPPLSGSVVSIDADASTPAVDATATYSTGSEFTVAFVIEAVGEPYQGYQFGIQRDPNVLAYVSVEHLQKANLTGCAPVSEDDGNRVAAGCLDLEARDITETGQMATITFRCAAAGTSPLDLLSPAEILSSDREGPGTKLVARAAPDGLPITMNDASVTCS
jgi:hypothetical protein